MPQMMPINWIMSFIIFISIYILFNILNYYIFYMKHMPYKNSSLLLPKKKLIWKW
uniref:ATP synthase complex subunit 8 n=1 Tax=Erionota torus TaxID=218728 RepID=A0A8E5NW92_9NEOP|nr:ATP synthase F0 subunit 8 [Erionota torus]